MREVWEPRAHNTHDPSDGDTATVADYASIASQGDDRSTTLNASQASSNTKSPTDTNCIIARTTAPGGEGGGEGGGGGNRDTQPLKMIKARGPRKSAPTLR
jgi:hypothetical protein